MSSRPDLDSAHAGWLAAIDLALIAERAETRSDLRGIAREPWSRATIPTSIFTDWARDAAEAFGEAEAAACTHAVLAAIIDAVRIIDDVQDEEPQCLATRVGVPRALSVAIAALEHALELTAALPVPETSWRAAASAVGRGIRETAIGQQLEATAESYWIRVDRKTPPLVATALELGALAAGAPPSRAAELTRLAIPLGRLLQIGDDCNDALGENASDWRAPHLNLLISYSLAGPRGEELRALVRRDAIREAKVLLLEDGALAYAIHAQLVTIDALAAILRELELPHPEPFVRRIDEHRAETESLLLRSGVEETLAKRVTMSG